MAYMIMHFETDDFDGWKTMFDSDPAGRRDAATGHVIHRGVDNPKQVFVRAEFDSTDQAQAFRDRLVGSGVLTSLDMKTAPTVVEAVEKVDY